MDFIQYCRFLKMADKFEKRVRKPNFTNKEIEILIEEVTKRPSLNTNELGKEFKNTKEIKDAWEEVANNVNSVSFTLRTGKEMKEKWQDLKCHVKKKAAVLSQTSIKTGGGPPVRDLQPIEEKILGFIGKSAVFGLDDGIETFDLSNVQNLNQRERLFNIGLVLVEPPHGCSTPINRFELQHNVALVERGGCSFLTKCIQGDRAGVLALIVTDNDIKNDEQYIDMIDDNTKRNCSIPAVFLLGKDGHMIRQRLQIHGMTRAIINIPINVTRIPIHQMHQPPWQLW